jgi:hypothetical protein
MIFPKAHTHAHLKLKKHLYLKPNIALIYTMSHYCISFFAGWFVNIKISKNIPVNM